MRNDHIKTIIMSDSLIIDYGNAYAFKHRHQKHLQQMVRARVRLIARLLSILRTIKPDIKNFCHLFVPENYDYLIPAINLIGKYNLQTDLYDCPASASAAGAYIKELCDLYVTDCIKMKKNAAKQDALDFLQLYNTNFSKYVSRTVIESQIKMQRAKITAVP